MNEQDSLSSASLNLGNTEISILIKNNRNYPQGVSVMGSPYASGGSINATTEYRWNFTGYTFNTSNTTLNLQYRGVGSTSYSTYSTPFNGNTIESVAQVLNSFGISQFNTYIESGQTFLSTYNDTTEFNDLTFVATNVSIGQDMVTQDGNFLVTEDQNILTTEIAATTNFTVQIINYPAGDPAISVTIQEGGGAGTGGGVTYEQVQQAFTQNNYEVQGLYLYSPQIEQISGTYLYNTFDATGNKQLIAIPNIIDPNQHVSSSLIDLSQYQGSIILNGNSFVSGNMLPEASLQIKFLAKAINKNGELPNNFLDIQEATGTKFFEPPAGDISEFERADAYILNQVPEEVVPMTVLDEFRYNMRQDLEMQKEDLASQGKVYPMVKKDYVPLVLLGVAAIAGIYLFGKKKD